MIHHSHVACDDCGERHTPGNPTECIGILLEQIVALKADIEGYVAMKEGVVERIGDLDEQIAALKAEVKRLREALRSVELLSWSVEVRSIAHKALRGGEVGDESILEKERQ